MVGVNVKDRVILRNKYKCEINNSIRDFENDGLIGTGQITAVNETLLAPHRLKILT